MIHTSNVDAYAGSMEQLVEEIGNLKYDALAQFLNLLSTKIQKDGDKDRSRNRIQLANSLDKCANSLSESKIAIDKAWKICEPYIK